MVSGLWFCLVLMTFETAILFTFLWSLSMQAWVILKLFFSFDLDSIELQTSYWILFARAAFVITKESKSIRLPQNQCNVFRNASLDVTSFSHEIIYFSVYNEDADSIKDEHRRQSVSFVCHINRHTKYIQFQNGVFK